MRVMRPLFSKLRNLPKAIGILLVYIAFAVVFIYYPVGMAVMHSVDDSPDFKADAHDVKDGSHTVAMMNALIDREVKQHYWTPNDPFFYPSALLVRMPAFQRGVMTALGRMAIELADQIGRMRGSSQVDADLQKAAGLLNYSPAVWMFDLSTSLLPTASSEAQYLAGKEALARYNERLAQDKAVFERRADNLLDTLDRFATDLGSSSAAIASYIDTRSGLAFTGSADLFYHTKGKMYTYYLLLRELERDFPNVIEEKQLGKTWEQMLDSLRHGMMLGNFIIVNAAPDSQVFPNHLAAQGFYLMRARTQLREITNILLK